MNADLAAQRALDHLKAGGFATLNTQDKVLATLWQFVAGVGNGGFESYFRSERADTAAFVPPALGEIGALAHASLAQRANALFAGGVPGSAEARRKELADWPADKRAQLTELDREYFNCEEDVDERLELYLQNSES
jgi:hypothetical protein